MNIENDEKNLETLFAKAAPADQDVAPAGLRAEYSVMPAAYYGTNSDIIVAPNIRTNI